MTDTISNKTEIAIQILNQIRNKANERLEIGIVENNYLDDLIQSVRDTERKINNTVNTFNEMIELSNKNDEEFKQQIEELKNAIELGKTMIDGLTNRLYVYEKALKDIAESDANNYITIADRALRW